MRLVSVLMPAYNHAAYVEEAVRSVLSQTVSDLELVVIDDGSTDDTFDRVQRIAATDDRVRLSSHPGGANRGRQETFAVAIEQSRGRWLAILSSDDVWLPTKLERQVPIMEEGAEFTYGRAGLMDTRSQPIRGRPIGQDAHGFDLSPFEALLRANYVPEVTVMFTRDLYDRSGGFQRDQEYQDLALWLRFMALTDPVFLGETLGSYRLSAGVMATSRAEGREFHAICSAVDGLQHWPGLPARDLATVQSWYRAHAVFLSLIDGQTEALDLRPNDAPRLGILLARRWRPLLKMVGRDALVEWTNAIEAKGPEFQACVDACFVRRRRVMASVGSVQVRALDGDLKGTLRAARSLVDEARRPDVRRSRRKFIHPG